MGKDMDGERNGRIPSHPFRWLPEFLAVNRQRWGSQVRLLGPAVLVGTIAGLGAVVFLPASSSSLAHSTAWRVTGQKARPARREFPGWASRKCRSLPGPGLPAPCSWASTIPVPQ